MKITLETIGWILLLGLVSVRTQALQIESNRRPMILADTTPKPGCRAQLNDSSCRPDKFPQHNPDPAIPLPPVQKDNNKIIIPPENEFGHQSVDCQFGVQKCYCTNKMAIGKARHLGIRHIRIHGYSDRVLVSGNKHSHRIKLLITRERTCPVINSSSLGYR